MSFSRASGVRVSAAGVLLASMMLAQAAPAQAPAGPYVKGTMLLGPQASANQSLPFSLLQSAGKIAYISEKGEIAVVNERDFPPTTTILPNPLPVAPESLVGNPDGTRLTVMANVPGAGGQIATLELATGTVLTRIQLPDRAEFGPIRFSRATGNVAVLTKGTGSRLLLFDGKTGALVFSADPAATENLTFSRDGSEVITSGADKSGRRALVEFWDAVTGTAKRTITLKQSVHGVPSGILAISPDGSLLAVQAMPSPGASVDHPIKAGSSALLIRAADGAEVGALKMHAGRLTNISFSDDGARILTSSWDRFVVLWNARTGEAIATLDGHQKKKGISENDYVAAYFAPGPLHPIWDYGDDAIISVAGDGEIVLWETKRHQEERFAARFAENLKKAEQGDSLSMKLVSDNYDEGRGIARDPVKAEMWLRRSAKTGEMSSSAMKLFQRITRAQGASQDCSEAGQLIRKAQAPTMPTDAMAKMVWNGWEMGRDEVLRPIGGTKGAASMPPAIQADLLETQMLDALTKQDHKAFLANLCAFEFLGHADPMPAAARNELFYHRAVALRAEGKPLPALTALNTYLERAGRAGANYTAAIQMLRPLQEEAAK